MNIDWYRSLPYDSARYDLQGYILYLGRRLHVEHVWKQRDEAQDQNNANLAVSWKMKLKLRGGS